MKPFVFDYRSLKAFRIMLGLMLLFDLGHRFLDGTAHYSDFGYAPRSLTIGILPPQHLSLYYISGDPFMIKVMMLIGILAAFFFTIGYKTRWSALYSYINLISLHSRNNLLLEGGDIYLRTLLCWAILLPLDYIAREDKLEHSNQVKTLATFGFTAHITILYIAAALAKTHPRWTTDFTAMAYAMELDVITTSFGKIMTQFPLFMKFGTFMTLVIEFLCPLFLSFPGTTIRYLGIIPLAGFHLLTGLFFHIGIFPLVGVLAFIPFLPYSFWDRWQGSHTLFVPVSSCPWSLKPYLVSLAALGLTLGSVFWLCRARSLTNYKPPYIYEWAMRTFAFYQDWDVFAPFPSVDDGWLVIEGATKNDHQIDLLHFLRTPFEDRIKASHDKPKDVYYRWPNFRWAKSLRSLWRPEEMPLRMSFVQYICKTWDQIYRDDHYKLTQIKITAHIEQLDDQLNQHNSTYLLIDYKCGTKPYVIAH